MRDIPAIWAQAVEWTWTDRNLLGSAEQLVLSARVIDINGSATNGIGYDVGGKVIVPEFLRPAQTLQFSLDALKQSLVAYDQTAETAGMTLTRNLSKVWTASVGITTTQETVNQPEEASFFSPLQSNFDYTLFALPVTLRYDSTGVDSPLVDPLHGMRVAVTVAPTLSLGPPDATFVISQVRASAYLDLNHLIGTAPGRSVVAVRGLYGYAQGAAKVTSLPPDQRFYAGGSGTIRGYRFQSAGPQFSMAETPAGVPQGEPQGGLAVQAASLELRQRVGRNYGFAVFADGGRVYGGRTDPIAVPGAPAPAPPPPNGYQFGAGVGIRYYTPIGPLRLDLAFPMESSNERRLRNDDRLEVYIGLGPAF
ncbi:MAG: BamA/TamA family outer membrane protein [Steroidobacteraceae bacterium]